MVQELGELDFVESPVEYRVLKPFFEQTYSGYWEMRLHTDTALVPLYLAKTTTAEQAQSLISDELINQTATFIERTRFYHQLWNSWMDWLEADNGPTYVSKNTAVHLFAPLYVQELEGPLRYQLATLIDFCGSKQNESNNWKDRLYKKDNQKKYFPSIQTEAIQKLQQVQGTGETDDLNDGYEHLLTALVLLAQNKSFAEDIEPEDGPTSLADMMDGNHPNAGAIRNAIAHADYRVERDGEETKLVLSINGTDYGLYLEPLLLYLNRQFTLIRALSVGVGLGLLYIMLVNDEDNKAGRLLHSFGF